MKALSPSYHQPKAPKAEKVVHPNSRVAAQLSRQMHRDEKVNKRQKERKLKVEASGEKLTWFLSHLDPSKSSYTRAEACVLIDRYLKRFDNEVEEHEEENKTKAHLMRVVSGRSTKIEMKKSLIERELNEFKSIGLEIPDILNGKNLAVFREWDGQMRTMQPIKLRRVKYIVGGTTEAKENDDLDSDTGDEQLVKDK